MDVHVKFQKTVHVVTVPEDASVSHLKAELATLVRPHLAPALWPNALRRRPLRL